MYNFGQPAVQNSISFLRIREKQQVFHKRMKAKCAESLLFASDSSLWSCVITSRGSFFTFILSSLSGHDPTREAGSPPRSAQINQSPDVECVYQKADS